MKLRKSHNTSQLLTKILADPKLPQKIRAASPQVLSRMVLEVGLEDSGEIIALATSEQLERVFDLDLWQAQKAGADELFDAERFGLWLQVMFELDKSVAAQKISEMDSDFVIMALSQLIWVIDFPSLQQEVTLESRIEKIMDSTSYIEIEDFVIFSRNYRTWDGVLALIVELDEKHHDFLRGILERCSHITLEQIENNGDLYSVLTAEEQLKEDVAYEREKRRTAQGYVPPAEARAFLKLAAGPLSAEDHLSPKHLRVLAAEKVNSATLSPKTEVTETIADRFVKVRSMLSADPQIRQLQMEELNYLANVLVAGGENQGRPIRPGEAALLVLETCEKGLTNDSKLNSYILAFRAAWNK